MAVTEYLLANDRRPRVPCEALRDRWYFREPAPTPKAPFRGLPRKALVETLLMIDPKTKERSVNICQGCQQGDPNPEPLDPKPYVVTFDDRTMEAVRYCDDCADMARMNWNGVTAAIQAVTAPPAHCADCTEYVRPGYCDACDALG